MIRRVLLALLLAAPLASAQAGFDLSVPDLEAPVPPLEGFSEVRAVVTVPCDLVGNSTGALVRFSFEDVPEWANFVATPSAVLVEPCEGATDVDTKVLVRVSEMAPALTPREVRVVSRLANGTANASDSEPLRFEAAYFGILDAKAKTTIAQARPQTEIRFPITVTNFGNGATKVFFEVASRPDGWQVVTPIPIVLESVQEGGSMTNTTVNLNVLTPYRNGYLNEVGAITLRITSAHALRPEVEGDATQLSVLATVKGWYVPAPGALLAAVALAGAALLIRSARRR